MKALRLLFGLFIAALALSGCKSVRPAEYAEALTQDSTHIEKTVTYRDTTFTTPAAEVTINVVETEIKQGLNPVEATVGNATITLRKNKGAITATCRCDSLKIKAQLRDQLEKEYRQKATTINTNTQATKEYTPLLTRILAWSGGIFWVIIAGYVIFRYRKKLFKLK